MQKTCLFSPNIQNLCPAKNGRSRSFNLTPTLALGFTLQHNENFSSVCQNILCSSKKWREPLFGAALPACMVGLLNHSSPLSTSYAFTSPLVSDAPTCVMIITYCTSMLLPQRANNISARQPAVTFAFYILAS